MRDSNEQLGRAADEANTRIDWRRLAPADLSDQRDVRAIADASARPHDLPLIESVDALDLTLRRVDVSECYPTRFEPATNSERERLLHSYDMSKEPADWIADINAGVDWADVEPGPGRTENCADCARAVQSTLEGAPIVAATIDARGLPTAGEPDVGGESPLYAERWAGERAEATSYDEVTERLQASQGSAIVFVDGSEGAHATNAAYDTATGRVNWLDGQLGIVDDWPPRDLTERFPNVRAIYFTSRTPPERSDQ